MGIKSGGSFAVTELCSWLAHARTHRVEWLVPGYVPAEGIVEVSGQPKLARKTTFTEVMALAMASGKAIGPFRPLRQCRVLLCEEEGTYAGTAERLDALMRGGNVTENDLRNNIGFAFRPMIKLDEAGITTEGHHGWSRILPWVAAAGGMETFEGEPISGIVPHYDVVILDTLTYMLQGDENSAKDMARAAETVRAIRSYGAATVIVLIHTRKNQTGGRGNAAATDIDDDPRGTSLWAGLYDVHLALRCARPNNPIVLTRRGRECAEERYIVKWEQEVKEKRLHSLSMNLQNVQEKSDES